MSAAFEHWTGHAPVTHLMSLSLMDFAVRDRVADGETGMDEQQQQQQQQQQTQ